MNRSIIKEREDRVNEYENRYAFPQKWYARYALWYKCLFQIIGLLIIALGAAVALVPQLLVADTSNQLVSVIGTLIVILKGIERIWIPEERWALFRKASEALRREKEMYIEGIDPYVSSSADEEKVYRLFVQRCLLVRAEEQNNFWGLYLGEQSVDESEHKNTIKKN